MRDNILNYKSRGSKEFSNIMDYAVAENADAVVLEYADAGLEVCYMFGNIGIGEVLVSRELEAELLEEHLDIHTVQFAMGVICARKGHHDQAIARFEKAIKIFPYFVEAWFNKGFAHQKRLEIAEMIRAYQQVIELGDPAEAFVQQAKDAIKKLEQHVREDKGLSLQDYLKAMDKFNGAFAAMQRNEWENAIRGFQQVLALDTTHTQSYGNIGICYGQLGRKQEAIEALDKALELDPEYQPALQNRRIIRELKEGEKLQAMLGTVNYYRDYSANKQPLFKRLLGRFLKS